MKSKILFCLCVVLILVTACSGKPAVTSETPAPAPNASASTAPASTPAPSAPAANEPLVTVTMLQRLNADYVVENNPVLAEFMKRAGVNLEIEAPPINNYYDRLNIVMASGDLPDVILVSADDNYRRWAADGLFLKLDDYLTQMPTVRGVLTDFELSNFRIPVLENGLYGLPRVQTKAADMTIYRADWLDELGLDVPTTPEEFHNVMYEFAHFDPNRSGKDDTYGLSLNTNINLRNYNWAFGIVLITVPGPDGEYRVLEAQDAYIDLLEWLASMYSDGSIDPEWYLNKGYDDMDKFTAGKAGAMCTNINAEHLKRPPEFYEANPGARLAAGPPLRAEGTNTAINYYEPQIWGGYCVNADTKVLDAVLQMLNYGYSTEANVMLYVGLEGVTYNTKDESLLFYGGTEEQAAARLKYCASYATFNFQREDKGLLAAGNSNTIEEAHTFMDTSKRINDMTTLVSFIPDWEAVFPGLSAIRSQLTDLNAKRDEMRTKFICGQISRDEWLKFVNDEFVPAFEPAMDIIRAQKPNQGL